MNATMSRRVLIALQETIQEAGFQEVRVEVGSDHHRSEEVVDRFDIIRVHQGREDYFLFAIVLFSDGFLGIWTR